MREPECKIHAKIFPPKNLDVHLPPNAYIVHANFANALAKKSASIHLRKIQLRRSPTRTFCVKLKCHRTFVLFSVWEEWLALLSAIYILNRECKTSYLWRRFSQFFPFFHLCEIVSLYALHNSGICACIFILYFRSDNSTRSQCNATIKLVLNYHITRSAAFRNKMYKLL